MQKCEFFFNLKYLIREFPVFHFFKKPNSPMNFIRKKLKKDRQKYRFYEKTAEKMTENGRNAFFFRAEH
jgi:hypothetical protein